MARQNRPQMDWTRDTELPERFEQWKFEVEAELKLFAGDGKKEFYLQKFIEVCAGKEGVELLDSMEDGDKPDPETAGDHKKIFQFLEKKIKPTNLELQASGEYFYLRQGTTPLKDFIRKAIEIVNQMNIEVDPKDKTLRNLLLAGLSSPEIHEECCKEDIKKLDSRRVIEIAEMIEERSRLRQKLSKTANQDLPKNAMMQASTDTSGIHKIKSSQKFKGPAQKAKQPQQATKKKTNKKCGYCGQDGWCKKTECPASGKKCSICGNIGHFAKMCRTKKSVRVHEVIAEEDEEREKLIFHQIRVHKISREGTHIAPIWISASQEEPVHQIESEIDTGADCSIMPTELYKKFFTSLKLDPSKVDIFGFGDHYIPATGSCKLTVHTVQGEEQERFHIVDCSHIILGREICKKINYIKFPKVKEPQLNRQVIIHQMKTMEVEQPPEVKKPRVNYNPTKKTVEIEGKKWTLPISKETILKDFEDVFTGVGELPGGECHLTLKEGAEPVQHPPRRVAEKIKEPYKATLDKMVSQQIIAPTDCHTDWISSIVPVQKEDGSLRLCLDPGDLNKALKRDPYHMRSIDEVSPELHGAKYFTLLDAKTGFWHIKLDEESSYLTTFNTPWGKYRFLRLPFGLKVSSDVFQQRLDAVTRTITDVTGIADDCLAKGNTMEQHDVALLTLLMSARMNGIKFNPKKMQFRTKECKFYGHYLTPEGFQQDPAKVEAILKMDPPKNKADLESFLGLVNYLKKYSIDLCKAEKPLRDLMKQGVLYCWESQQQKAFEKIKEAIIKAPVLAYFNPKAQHVIQTDASKKGLGAVLLQEGHPVTFASRALTPTEAHYSSIERELLGVEFGLRRLYNFTHGDTVTLQTDHKPLVPMFNREILTSTPRQQRLLVKIHDYDVKLEYVRGKDNSIADALSRVSPLKPQAGDLKDVPRIRVNEITATVMASESRLDRVRKATAADPELSQLAHFIHHGWPLHRHQSPQAVHPYWHYKEELSLEAGLIYKGSRLVVPATQKEEFLRDLHTGHLGEDKTLALARETVYWTGITEDIRMKIKNCEHCQQLRPSQQKEPLQPHDVPAGPWQKLGIDFFELKGQNYLLIADYYSRFPIVKHVKSMTAKATILKLKTIFSEMGIPAEVMTDQGTQFTSQEFKEFAGTYRFKITHSSPRYPQSNGFIESMVKVTKDIITKANAAKEDTHLAMLAYRTTPLGSGRPSPADLLKNRKMQCLLPIKGQLSFQQEMSREKDIKSKEAQAELYNQHAKRLQELENLQRCRIQLQPNQRQWTPATVIESKPGSDHSYLVQTDDGARYERNRRFIKPAPQPTASPQKQGATQAPPPLPSGSSGATPVPCSSPGVSTAPPLRRSSRGTNRPTWWKDYQVKRITSQKK